MPKEKLLFRDDEVTITSSRAIFGPTTYAVANLASVSSYTEEGQTTFVFCFVGIAAMFGLVGVLVTLWLALRAVTTWAWSSAAINGLIAVFFLAVVISGYLLYQRMPNKEPDTYIVRSRTASGEVDALESEDLSHVYNIVEALNRAVARSD